MSKLTDFLLLRHVRDLFWICGFYLFTPTLLIGSIFLIKEGKSPAILDYIISAPLIYILTASFYCSISGRGYLLKSDPLSAVQKIEDQLSKQNFDKWQTALLLQAVRKHIPEAVRKDAEIIITGLERP